MYGRKNLRNTHRVSKAWGKSKESFRTI